MSKVKELKVLKFEDNTFVFFDGKNCFAPVSDVLLVDGSIKQMPVRLMELKMEYRGKAPNGEDV